MEKRSQNNDDVRILAVDDVEINLLILEEIIKDMGYQPLLAQNVKEALEILENSEVLPRVILSDISMPDIDGYAFCSMLKKDSYTKDIPVIFISAMDSADDLSKGFELGAADYIPKPFDQTEVQMRISTHLKLYTMQKDLEENNRQLRLVVARQMDKVRLEQKNAMTALARIVETREQMPGDHYENILYNSRILAEGMQLSSRFEDEVTDDLIDTIESSSGLHDIGKLLIPDAILSKGAQLDGTQREVMRTHAALGAELLTDSYKGTERNDFIDMAIDIARSHHECWDGSGYPEGLKGEEIPLAARIVKVVDVFDALTGGRHDRTPLPLEEALRYMQDNAGTAFDPDIIRVFMRIYRNFRGIGRDLQN